MKHITILAAAFAIFVGCGPQADDPSGWSDLVGGKADRKTPEGHAYDYLTSVKVETEYTKGLGSWTIIPFGYVQGTQAQRADGTISDNFCNSTSADSRDSRCPYCMFITPDRCPTCSYYDQGQQRPIGPEGLWVKTPIAVRYQLLLLTGLIDGEEASDRVAVMDTTKYFYGKEAVWSPESGKDSVTEKRPNVDKPWHQKNFRTAEITLAAVALSDRIQPGQPFVQPPANQRVTATMELNYDVYYCPPDILEGDYSAKQKEVCTIVLLTNEHNTPQSYPTAFLPCQEQGWNLPMDRPEVQFMPSSPYPVR